MHVTTTSTDSMKMLDQFEQATRSNVQLKSYMEMSILWQFGCPFQ